MSSQPVDEDGFHSIAWDDAPRVNHPDVSSPLDKTDEGFETISPSGASSPPADITGASSSTTRQYTTSTDDDPTEWDGRWMVIQVKDPVREHEGSKDQYVSYAVRTHVRLGLSLIVGLIVDQLVQLLRSTHRCQKTVSRFQLSTRTPGEELSSVCRSAYSRQAPSGIYQGRSICARIRREEALRVSYIVRRG